VGKAGKPVWEKAPSEVAPSAAQAHRSEQRDVVVRVWLPADRGLAGHEGGGGAGGLVGRGNDEVLERELMRGVSKMKQCCVDVLQGCG
jgi:hypothetical protein